MLTKNKSVLAYDFYTFQISETEPNLVTKSLLVENYVPRIASFNNKLVIFDGKSVFFQNLLVMTCDKADFVWHREGSNLLNITGAKVEHDRLQVTSVVF